MSLLPFEAKFYAHIVNIISFTKLHSKNLSFCKFCFEKERFGSCSVLTLNRFKFDQNIRNNPGN